jgi:hypothetical protein
MVKRLAQRLWVLPQLMTKESHPPLPSLSAQRSSLLSPRALFHQAFTLEGQSTSFLPFTSILCVP